MTDISNQRARLQGGGRVWGRARAVPTASSCSATLHRSRCSILSACR